MLTGKNISELSNDVALSCQLSVMDYLMFSETDFYRCGVYNSRKVSAKDFMYYVNSNVLQMMDERFGTMYRENSADYSLSSHNHDGMYTKIKSITYNGYDPEGGNVISIGKYRLDGRISTLYIPNSNYSAPYASENSMKTPKFGSERPNPQQSSSKHLINSALPPREGSLVMFYDVECSCSKAFRFEQIYEDVFQAFLLSQDVKSMAYENACDYAKLSHDHDNYNKIWYEDKSVGLEKSRISIDTSDGVFVIKS